MFIYYKIYMPFLCVPLELLNTYFSYYHNEQIFCYVSVTFMCPGDFKYRVCAPKRLLI